ncbi:MAG: SIMPL domain-containing protein [Cryomorphaceae bacterium]
MKTLTAALILIFASLFSFAQSDNGVIKVKGEAVVSAVPENMELTIPMEVSDSSYEACNEKVAQMYNELQRALIKSGIDESKITSIGISVRPDYHYQGRGEKKLIGYNGNVSMQIDEKHTDKNLNAILKTLRNDKFSFGYSVSFDLSDSQRDFMREEAIVKATADARKKAELLASSLSVGLAQIREISYGFSDQGTSPLVYRSEAKMMDSSGMEDVEINARKIEITRQVSVTWNINQ